MGVCGLCGSNAPLLKSHIIPKFTVDWLKRTSATGYLRQAIQPNIRKQDAPTKRLLCAACEGLFSKSEKLFAENIWVPYQDKGIGSFEYDGWLRSFAISLAWRTVTVGIEEFRQNNPDLNKLTEAADEALLCWKNHLLNKSANPGPYENHLLFVNNINVDDDEIENVPDKTFHYLRRSFDATIMNNSIFISAYTKLPGIILFSTIRPYTATKWKGTRISRKGMITTAQQVTDERFGDFIGSRVKFITEANLSVKQREQINKSIMANPDRTFNSDSFNTFLMEKEFRKQQ